MIRKMMVVLVVVAGGFLIGSHDARARQGSCAVSGSCGFDASCPDEGFCAAFLCTSGQCGQNPVATFCYRCVEPG
jgi:hypothetical protein